MDTQDISTFKRELYKYIPAELIAKIRGISVL